MVRRWARGAGSTAGTIIVGSTRMARSWVERSTPGRFSDIEILACSTTVTIAARSTPAPRAKLGKVDDIVEFAAAPASISCCSRCRFGGDADLDMLKKAVGAAGRHPAFRHTNLLRFRPRAIPISARCRRSTCRGARSPIGTWCEWLFDHVVGAICCCWPRR